MIRLLHVHSGNLFGGVESMLLALKKAEPAELDQSFALCWQARFAEELAALGTNPHALPAVHLRHPFEIMRARRALGALLHRARPDVIAFHSAWTQLVFAKTANDAQIPFVRFIHGIPSQTDWMDALAMRRRPRMLICNGEFTERRAAQVFPKVPRAVVRPPVDVDAFARDEEARARIRAELDVDAGTVVILQVARIEPLKGHRLHLEALTQLRTEQPWRAWFVGGAQRESEVALLEELKQTAHRFGLDERVSFLGERRDIAALMSAADILCQPNTSPDSFGIVFVEALAAGLAVVTTHMGGGAAILAGGFGTLSLADSKSVAGALSKQINDSRARHELDRRGIAHAIELCEPKAQSARLVRALTKCCL